MLQYKRGDLLKLMKGKLAPKIIKKKRSKLEVPSSEPKTKDYIDYLARLAEKAKVPSVKLYEKVMAEQKKIKDEAEKTLSEAQKARARQDDVDRADEQLRLLDAIRGINLAGNTIAQARARPVLPSVLPGPAPVLPFPVVPSASVGPASPTGLITTKFVPSIPPPSSSGASSGPPPSYASKLTGTVPNPFYPPPASPGPSPAIIRAMSITPDLHKTSVDKVSYQYELPPGLTKTEAEKYRKTVQADIRAGTNTTKYKVVKP